MLHILNGDAVIETFMETNIEGKHIIWREVFCQGPTLVNIDSEESRMLRSRFLHEFFGEPVSAYFDKWESQLELMKSVDLQRVTLWFEYDLFCQFNMMAAINLIHSLDKSSSIFIINVGKTLEQKEWVTLSHLNSAEWKILYKQKKMLSAEHILWMTEAWSIYNSAHHEQFDSLMDSCPISFKYFPQAIENHYRRFHSRADNLTDIQRFLLHQFLKDDCIPKNQLLRDLINHFHYYGYGDQQFTAMIKALPFIESQGDNFCFLGALDHKMNLSQLPDMTYGGMHNKSKYVEDFIEI